MQLTSPTGFRFARNLSLASKKESNNNEIDFYIVLVVGNVNMGTALAH